MSIQDAYHELLFDLAACTNRLAIGEDPLAAYSAGLDSLVRFIARPCMRLPEQVTTPLIRLASTISGVSTGGRWTKVVGPAYQRTSHDGCFRPVERRGEQVRGLIVAALKVAIKTGMSSMRAGNWIGRELILARVTLDGKVITGLDAQLWSKAMSRQTAPLLVRRDTLEAIMNGDNDTRTLLTARVYMQAAKLFESP